MQERADAVEVYNARSVTAAPSVVSQRAMNGKRSPERRSESAAQTTAAKDVRILPFDVIQIFAAGLALQIGATRR